MTIVADPPRAPGRWIGLLSLANLGLWMGYFGPLQVLLPNQIEDITPDSKTTALGIVTGLGALVAVIVGPVAGALSDATTARTGRRHTWIVAGALIGAAGLVALDGVHSVAGVAIGWCFAQVGLNVLQAGLTAVVPDQTPVDQRGVVSGWVGLTQSVGVVAGVLLVTMVGGGYWAIAVVVVVLAVPFVLGTRDPLPAVPARFDLRGTFRWHGGDFAWAFGTRFLVQLGNAMATLYLLYFLRDKVHYSNADDGLAILIIVYTIATVMTVVIGGVISDRTGKRKPSVIASGLVMAVSMVLLAVWPTWPGALTAAVILGLGFGVYLSVDQALITQVLPSAEDRGRDLGVINIANSAPQVLGPALAFPLVTYLGGYPVLFLTVAVITVLGSVLVTRIRSVA
ncbi:MFS family permease [Actinoplanes tereljensis]|uniref:MFS transporter n=1 Tax=Paractinoplanes tereljensis TaxID=571912 RepID=A0A919NVR0_9ACTN|nr:MFS transporter [Actinoplanes tereljensis]GIF26080.1 MFS transporter [Actinoplanes tereljensis]